MKRVLVSGASGIVGYGALRSLRRSGHDCFLVGTSIHLDSVAPAFCDAFEQAPRSDAPEYLEWLLGVLHRYRIDLLIPGIEIDVYRWVELLPQIRATGALPMLNTTELIALCRDKWLFHERLSEAGLDCIIESALVGDYAQLAQRFGVPFLLKPRRSHGSRGIVRVASADEFRPHQAALGPTLMAQPIIGSDDDEFTLSAFCDGEGGYFACMALRRKLSPEGFTDRAEVVDSGEFEPVLGALCGLLRPLGPTNFQFRLSPDGPKLLEINPRVSSSTSIRTAFGYNECAMALDFFLERRTPRQPSIQRGRAVRYTDEQIFYEDGLHL